MPHRDWMTRWLNAVLWDATSSRVQRGWRYWQDGLVTDLKVGKGELHARVVGSRRDPYQVSMHGIRPPVGEESWRSLLERATETPDRIRHGALDARLRQAIEDSPEVGAPVLFQEGAIFSCTCLDWENPCKHAVAMVYAFATQIAENPARLLDLYWENFAASAPSSAASTILQFWHGAPDAPVPQPSAPGQRVDLPLRVKPPKAFGGAVPEAMATILNVVTAVLEQEPSFEQALAEVWPPPREEAAAADHATACPQCGASLSPDWRFCTTCGHRVDRAE